MKKKLYIFTLIVVLLLAGCGNDNSNSRGDEQDAKESSVDEGKQTDDENKISDDVEFSNTYLAGFDYSSYADVYGMAPVIICRIRYDKKLEADFVWEDENGNDCAETRVYELSDGQYSNIADNVSPKEISTLDPELSDPDDVCDGGSSWLFVYDSTDSVFVRCGGFCPRSPRFNEIRRTIFANLPEVFIDEYSQYEADGYLASGDDDAGYQYEGEGTLVEGELYTFTIIPEATTTNYIGDEVVGSWAIEVVSKDNGERKLIHTTLDEYTEYYPDAEGLLYEDDVNFDGVNDVVIYHGTLGVHGIYYYECYLNIDGTLEKCEGFEEIPDYRLDDEQKQIVGYIRDGADAFNQYYYVIDDAELSIVKSERYEVNPETLEYEQVW